MQSINERLKCLRKNYLQLTQNQLGKAIGVTGFVISDVEKGKSNLTERNLSAICKTFNVNEDWFRNGKGEVFKQLNREEELKFAIEKILANEKDSFKERLLKVLISSTESELEILENFAIKLANNKSELKNIEESNFQENTENSLSNNALNIFNQLDEDLQKCALEQLNQLLTLQKNRINPEKKEKHFISLKVAARGGSEKTLAGEIDMTGEELLEALNKAAEDSKDFDF